jgi:seryl-tRNA synthetase
MLPLVEHSELRFDQNGMVNLTGDLLNYFNKLDHYITQLDSKLKFADFHFPPFISAAEIAKVDYLGSFPHLATFALSLKETPENLQQFSNGERVNEKGELLLSELAPTKLLLTPATCYHFYIHHQNQELAEAKYVTATCHCFRREEYFKPLYRQSVFSMRELVCMGGMDEVMAYLERLRPLSEKLAKDLKLDIHFETASDPFFNPSKNPKALLQKLQPNKTEMIYKKELAIGSLNFHRNYFGQSFNITLKQESCFTACVAFGLHRWLFALIDTHGSKVKAWPAPWGIN